MPTTYRLTDDQKRRLEAQVAYASALIQEAKSRATWKTTFFAFLSHPAFITILGGGLLALILANYQQRSALHEKQLEIAATLPAQLHKAGTILAVLQGATRRVMPPNSEAATGNSRPPGVPAPTNDIFKTVLKAYISQPEETATLAQVSSWFYCDPTVIELARDTDDLFESFENRRPEELKEEEITAFRKAGEEKVHRLSAAMARAVNPGGKCYHPFYAIF